MKDEAKEECSSPNYQVALDFINRYVRYCNSAEREDMSWINHSDMVTSSFKRAYRSIIDSAKKSDPELGLGFDPIFDAQDYPQKGFDLVQYHKTKGLVIVKGKDWSDFTLVLRIVNENKRWLVEGSGVINVSSDLRAKR